MEDQSKQAPPSGIIVVVVFFVLLFVFSKWGPSIPFSVLSQSKGEPMVVTGEGKSTAIPDIAKVSGGIQDSGPTLTQVQNSVNKKSQNLVAALKSLGIEDKDIKTSAYNIYPQSNYDADPPVITGYQVSISYEVTVREVDKINEVMTTLTGAGANLVGGVSFELSDDAKNKAMDAARQEAVAQAKENAQSLAKASGVTLGRIINVSESSNSGSRPIYLADKAVGLGGGAPEAPEIQPGTTEVDITVALSYEVR
jgi:hypothetical protein